MKDRYRFCMILLLFAALVISPAMAAASTDPCNIPVIRNLDGPAVIEYDKSGQVRQTYSFSADVTGGTPPYTYTWRFGGGSENVVQGTGPSFARVSHMITDKWVVVSLQVTDSAGRQPAYQATGRSLFTLGWESEPGTSGSQSAGNFAGVIDSSTNPEGGYAYIHKVPEYPYPTLPCGPGTSSTTGPTSPTDESGIPWVPVVGLAAVIIAAIAIAAKMKSKKPGGKEKEKEKKEEKKPAGYILQISPSDTVNVSSSAPGSFSATVWKVDEAGTPVRANSAVITIIPPSGIPGLSVTPLSGTGSVEVSVSLDQPSGVDSAKIQVNASAGGGGTSATVTVKFESETSIEFE